MCLCGFFSQFIILHYVIQPKSRNQGENYLVDAFEVCKQMKNYDSQMYSTLANTVVEWTDTSQHEQYEMHHIHRAPVIWYVIEIQKSNLYVHLLHVVLQYPYAKLLMKLSSVYLIIYVLVI